MAFKINVAHAGKTFKVDVDSEDLVGKTIGESLQGGDLSGDLQGYELEITGTSDKAGFAGMPDIDGPNLRKVLLGYGPGMKKRPKGERKKSGVRRPGGLRLRKTVRGKEISLETVQINTKVVKEGSKKFDELFKAPEAASEGDEKKE